MDNERVERALIGRAPRRGDRLVNFPRWIAPINWGVAFPLAHTVLPWSFSLRSARHGWPGGFPGGWNLIGILAVGAGLATIVWALSLHFVSAEQGWELELDDDFAVPASMDVRVNSVVEGGRWLVFCPPFHQSASGWRLVRWPVFCRS